MGHQKWIMDIHNRIIKLQKSFMEFDESIMGSIELTNYGNLKPWGVVPFDAV